MKSKQINFFITPNDFQYINHFIKTHDILIYNIETEKVDEIKENMHQVFLTKENYIDNLVFSSTKKGDKYFDIGRSYVLEVSLGGFYTNTKKDFTNGRVYFVMSYYEGEHLIYKSDSFNKWCEQFIKFLKKDVLKKYPIDKDYLYSQSAIEWINTNDAVQSNSGQCWKST
jgi:hypothetical protein